jgi:hypothetical protein
MSRPPRLKALLSKAVWLESNDSLAFLIPPEASIFFE